MPLPERQPFATGGTFGSLILVALISVLLLPQQGLIAGDFGFNVIDVEAVPGEPFAMSVEGDWTANIGGFQLSLQLPFGLPVDDLGISVDNTLVGELDPDFLQRHIQRRTEGRIDLCGSIRCPATL